MKLYSLEAQKIIFRIFRHNYDFVFNSLLILDVEFLVAVTVIPMH